MGWFLHNKGNGLKWIDWKKIVFVSDIALCAAILFLPYLLTEIPDYFFLKNQNTINWELWWAEWIWHLTTWSLKRNVSFMLTWRMLRCADMLMIALHYIFNVTYTKKIEATMICVQRLLLEIHDNQKIPPKVLSLICK